MLVYYVLFYYYVARLQLVSMETNQLLIEGTNCGSGRQSLLHRIFKRSFSAPLWTHHILTDTSGSDLQIVPGNEQDQEEGKHVKLPVPHCHHEHLQEEGGQRSDISEGRQDGGAG